MTTYPQPSDPVSALTRADGSTEAHSADHGRIIGAWENVLGYGAVGDNSTDDATAIQAAIDAVNSAGGGTVYFPPATYKIASSLTIYTDVRLLGAGSYSTAIHYTGSGTAIAQSTPGTRIYGVIIEHLSVTGSASGAIGIDMDAVSLGAMNDVVVTGFTAGTGIRFNSSATGLALYNTLTHVTVTSCATGLALTGESANENTVVGGNFRGCTTHGINISASNHNKIIGCALESNGVGVYITATTTDTDGNSIVSCRFESNTTGIEVASSNVRSTSIVEAYFDSNTTAITDSGSRTSFTACRDVTPRVSYKSAYPATSGTPFYFERESNGGSSIPAFQIVDSADAAGTPITLKLETERTGGKHIVASRGVTTNFSVDSTDGDTFIGGDAEIDGALNHDGTTVGFYGVAPATRPTAYTQTYSTADKTHAAPTAAALTVADGAGTNDGTIGAITGDASVIAAVQELADQINKLIVDHADTKQLVNSVIDDLQTLGLLQ